jgi:hypothetical protein
MTNLLKRIRVLLSAAPTYLAGAAVVVAAVSDEVAKAVPEGWQDNVVSVGAPILAGLAAITAIVRRVTPVFAEHRGLIPVDER